MRLASDMNTNFFLFTLVTFSLLATGCEEKTTSIVIPMPTPILEIAPKTATNTLETKRLGKAIDLYIATPSGENNAAIKKAFAELDGEIAELEIRVARITGEDRSEAQGKLINLQAYRAAEATRYQAAQIGATTVTQTPVDTRSGAEKVENGIKNVAEGTKDTAGKISDTIRKGAENIGEKIKDATGN
jgi:hypothetical protein